MKKFMNRFFNRFVRLKKVRTLAVMALVVLEAVLIVPATSFAAGAVPAPGTPFIVLYNIVTGWLSGPLALTLSLAAASIGLGVWIVRQNPRSALKLMGLPLFLLGLSMAAPLESFAAGAVPVATDPFFNLYTIINGWLTGPLALTLSLAAVIIGLGVGIVRQNPMPAVAGIAFAVFATVLPGIIVQVMGAII